ncbi:zinc ribbon domain-containing protein [uncultured Clostridium sp.]|uniref:zinc ribbon domain-containing protein n=1 Tax=uncultured Clostridium sp. TaxID=59620 RepID=UPI0025FB9D75|nr:zinc ribbon domain-containing protein [uncultured Clostridium sp.]
MKQCKNCGSVLDEKMKFCTKCGAVIKKESSRKKLGIFAALIIIAAAIFSSAFYYVYVNKKSLSDVQTTKIESINIEKYPEVHITILNGNKEELLENYKLTVKENEAYQKNVKINKNEDGTSYDVSYESSDKKSTGNRKVIVSFSKNNSEIIVDSEYEAPEIVKEKSDIINSADNSVNTYDENEIQVKNLVEEYLNDGIRSINSYDIYYVKDKIDPASSMMKEIEQMLVSYKQQEITESLSEYRIENIEKISDNEYEVSTFERYRINYGKKKEIKDLTFRSKYLIKKVGNSFKVNSLKEINTL